MSTARRLAKNIFSLFTGSFISNVLRMTVTVYIARRFGADTFGMLMFASALIGYFGFFTQFGIPYLGMREIARDKGLTQEYAGSIIVIRMLFSLICFLILIGIIFFIPMSVTKAWIVVLYGLALFPIAADVVWVFQAHEKMEYRTLLETISSGLYVVLVFVIIGFWKNIILIPILHFISMLAATLTGFYIFYRFFGKLKIRPDFKYWRAFSISALPMGLSGFMYMLYMRFDTILLSVIKGDTAVGFYNAPYKIILFLISFSGFYVTAIFPILSREYKQSLQRLQSLAQRSVRLMATVSVPAAVGGIFLAKPIMDLVFGVDYAEGILAFQILSLTASVIFLYNVFSNILLACDRQTIHLKIVIIMAVVGLSLDFLLIPRFSLYGAAAATVIAQICGLYFSYKEVRKFISVSVLTSIWKPLIASLVMGIVLYFLSGLSVLMLIPAGAAAYFIFLIIIKGINREDIVTMKSLFVKNG
ncbi:MAG: flippase [Elusimicrobia bacterium]|nr:flippase [Elusimicrobiota bacterium]